MTALADQAALYGRGISFPPRVSGDGRLVWSSGELNVRECIALVLTTRPGERVGDTAAYGCGLDRFLHEPASVGTLRLVTEEVQRALAQWEPRIRLDDVTATTSPADPRAVDVVISYTLVATGLAASVNLTVSPDGSVRA